MASWRLGNCIGRDSAALNTSAETTTTAPAWKQEVHRRVAAHKSRRYGPAVEPEAPVVEARAASGSLAAQAAARVAARYAQAPSYNQMQAAEARVAVRAAEIATRVAREAQANARAVIAGIESAVQRPQPPEPVAMQTAPAPVAPAPASLDAAPLPVSHAVPLAKPTVEPQPDAFLPQPHFAAAVPDSAEDWWQTARPEPMRDPLGAEKLDRLQAALPEMPIHANLIEFPRAASAAHKPRHHAAPGEPQSSSQLSIFEVDPVAVEELPAPSLSSPWSGIELEAAPDDDPAPAPDAPKVKIELASFSRRLLAAVVDGALIAGALLAAAFAAASHMDHLPSVRALQFGALPALFVVGLFYQALFFTLSDATPGMRYARVSLCDLEGHCPTRAQLHGRLGALLLSLFPIGLGLAWAIFDEDHLTWHDRLSRTYQRKCEV